MAEVLTHNQTHATPQDALLHYGVKGMRWGVTNKDKAGSSRQSAREAEKAVKRSVKVGEVNARIAKNKVYIKELDAKIAATTPGVKGAYSRKTYRDMKSGAERQGRALEKKAEAIEAGRLTPNQKKLIIGGAIVGGLILANYGASKVESGELNALKLRGQAALRGKPFDFARNESFAKASTIDQVKSSVLPGINPGYNVPGGQMNCRRCSFTYELRRRGYSVEATRSALGYGQSETGLINALTPGARNRNRATSLSSMVVSGAQNIRTRTSGDTRKHTADTYSVADAKDRKSLFDTLNRQPAGARGEAVFNFGQFGHSLAYEKFRDGSIHIFDSQKGKSYNVGNGTSYKSFLDKWGIDAVKNVEITRLDNLELDNAFLARWATNQKG